MAVFPVHPVIWSSLLVLWFLQSAATESHWSDFCQEFMGSDYELPMVQIQSSAGPDYNEDPKRENGNFTCLLYARNELNCSWSLNTLEADTQLSACIGVCDEETVTDSTECTSVEKVGWMPLTLSEKVTEVSVVILRLNMSQRSNWTSYTFMYDMDTLEVLSPPPNISASFSDEVLTVTWDLPHTRKHVNFDCFEYELDTGDQEGPKQLVGMQNYTKLNADPAHTYRVRMRTRIINEYCSGSLQWSEWSPTVTVSVEPSEQLVSTLSPLVIALICLGIPMILLAVLLFVRYQRYCFILPPDVRLFLLLTFLPSSARCFSLMCSVLNFKCETDELQEKDKHEVKLKKEK